MVVVIAFSILRYRKKDQEGDLDTQNPVYAGVFN